VSVATSVLKTDIFESIIFAEDYLEVLGVKSVK